MKRILLYGFLFFSLLLVLPAHAHKPSDSYLSMNVEGKKIQGQWDIALRDLDSAIGLDGNGDGAITWGELRVRHSDIVAYALARLTLTSGAFPCLPHLTLHQVNNHTDGAYAVIRFEADCPDAPESLEIAYRLLFDLDPTHRGLLNLTFQGKTQTAIFSPEDPVQRLNFAIASPWGEFFSFVKNGVWHILIGFDHILFLLALLLPAVLQREAGSWQAVVNFRKASWDVFKIVTAFTLAHSITLSLASLSIVQLPSRFVESAIAASVVLAALNNLYPFFQGRRFVVAFVFGLIHGFGFASVLTDLGLPQGALLLSLIGFNVGVEIGQLAIVSLFLPVAYWFRNSVFYQRVIFAAGSIVIAVLAFIWMVERMFNMKWLPF